jgi:hypothetical protein
MARYKPKNEAEIAAMSDERLFNTRWWTAIGRHDDKQTWALLHAEIERRRKLIFGRATRRIAS